MVIACVRGWKNPERIEEKDAEMLKQRDESTILQLIKYESWVEEKPVFYLFSLFQVHGQKPSKLMRNLIHPIFCL